MCATTSFSRLFAVDGAIASILHSNYYCRASGRALCGFRAHCDVTQIHTHSIIRSYYVPMRVEIYIRCAHYIHGVNGFSSLYYATREHTHMARIWKQYKTLKCDKNQANAHFLQLSSALRGILPPASSPSRSSSASLASLKEQITPTCCKNLKNMRTNTKICA